MCEIVEGRVVSCDVSYKDILDMKLREKYDDNWYAQYEIRHKKSIGIENPTSTGISSKTKRYLKERDNYVRKVAGDVSLDFLWPKV